MENNQYLLYSNTIIYREFQSQGLLANSSKKPAADMPSSFFDELFMPAIAEAVDRTIETGASAFRREIMLPRLIPVGPDEIADQTATGRWRMVGRLARALRGERTRGRAGHWTYSLNRHIGLLQAFRAERAALRRLHPKAVNGRQISVSCACN